MLSREQQDSSLAVGFLVIEASPKTEEAEREKSLPMQYKFSTPKEKMKREMESFHGISD